MAQGIVHFVGAGPGHPGLITLRGVECLQRADVVLYDYLANEQILSHAPATTKLICLGQHGRSPIWPQASINQELVRRAQQGSRVVRLKGGDPMVFGRAAEELTAVVAAGVPFEVVPGVTAAIAAGAFAGITLTDRQHASAVALVTGHEQLGKPASSVDYQALAKFPGTLVVYMGVQTAADWSQSLLQAGKPADTPVMALRRLSWPDQRNLQSTLGELPQALTRAKIRPPVVFIIGETARQNPAFDWFGQLPLRGKVVVVTRPRHQAESMVRQLNELGAQTVLQPAIRIEEPQDWTAVDEVLLRLHEFDGLVFSSANGVHAFLRRLLHQGKDMRDLAQKQLAVIGPQTANALASYHLMADVQPDEFRAEALADALTADARGKRFLLLRASRGREILAERLSAAGGNVTQVVVYQSVDVTALESEVQSLAQQRRIDWVTVTSSAIAKSICRLMGADLQHTRLASISPITSQTLRDEGWEPAAEACQFTAAAVIDAIVTAEQES